ncbi:MAG: four helix bundle protein [Polyangiaceae bacterium]|nr:four helix bundle protein [Polyangiaceae bacterium]
MTESEREARDKNEGVRTGARGRRRGAASAAVPPLVIEMEDLTLWVIGRVSSFPRDHRFTLGDRLIESCLAVVDALVEASFTRDKLGLLLAAARSLTRARTLVRLCNRAGFVSDKQRNHFAERTDEIGRKLSGWTRQVRSR